MAAILQILPSNSCQKPINHTNDSVTVDISKINIDLRFCSRPEIQEKISVDIRNENIAIHMVYDEEQNFKAD